MADTFLFAQLQPYSLSGAGASIGDTSITLKSMLDIDGNTLSMSGTFGSIGFGTLEPGNGANEEQISFTGLTNNSNGTVTLSGVKSVAFVAPYTATSGLLKTHAGSTTFVISNTSGFYDRLSAKDDDETITGLWNFPNNSNYPTVGTTYVAPTTDLQIATKKYADDLAIAGAPKASTTTFGIAILSTNPVSALSPVVVGDNDKRVPPVDTSTITSGEVQALAGTVGTPSSGNKYVTDSDTRLAGYGFFGDGSDGDVTISVDTTITRDMCYNSLTIQSGKILNTANYRIFVKTTLDNQGTIRCLGVNGATGSRGVAVSAGTMIGGANGGDPGAAQGGGGGSGGGVVFISARTITNQGTISVRGGNGGNATAGAGVNTAGSNGASVARSLISSGTGGNGGAAGASSAGNGGSITVNSKIAQGAVDLLLPMFDGVGQLGGGAGGGGGAVNGSSSSSGGGGGGQGGVIVFIYKTMGVSGTLTISGGTKGTKDGASGSDGVDGSSGLSISIQV